MPSPSLPRTFRGHLLAATTVLTSLSLCGASWAQGEDEFGPYGIENERKQSPQTRAFELRFGHYYPNVDDEFSGNATPFADHFGEKKRYLLGFEYDWQLLRIPYLGTLGPGVGLGFTSLDGNAYFDDESATPQETSLTIIPMHLVGVLRADVVTRRTPLPLVPYAKLGFGWGFWWMDEGNGIVKTESGLSGSDISYGWQWAVGIMLELDGFEPAAAANLDATSGINHSYLFAEWSQSDLDGFGAGDQMQVGTESWTLGLALEF